MQLAIAESNLASFLIKRYLSVAGVPSKAPCLIGIAIHLTRSFTEHGCDSWPIPMPAVSFVEAYTFVVITTCEKYGIRWSICTPLSAGDMRGNSIWKKNIASV
jgi:hypothetical protein